MKLISIFKISKLIARLINETKLRKLSKRQKRAGFFIKLSGSTLQKRINQILRI